MSRLIDADALIEELNNSHFPGAPYVDAGISIAIGKVLDAPTIEPKRKTGKWTLLEECANAGYYCSECRKRVVKEGWSGTVKKIKFCPNCGADMRSETEREIK